MGQLTPADQRDIPYHLALFSSITLLVVCTSGAGSDGGDVPR